MLRYTNPDEIIKSIQMGKEKPNVREVSADRPLISRRSREPDPVTEDPIEANKQMVVDYLEMIGLAPEVTEELVEEAPTRPQARLEEGEIVLGEGSDSVAQGYPVSQKELESIIINEAKLRNIDPTVAVSIFRHEGAGAYQSQIERSGKGSLGGKEASFGPFQLYIGGGLGNQYQEETGRDLTQDNSLEGLTKQIQFSLDAAVDSGWGPWYGRIPAGIDKRQGLEEAQAVGNWRDS